MDTNTIILISVFCGMSSVCLCCISIKYIQTLLEEKRKNRLKAVAKRIQERFKYNSINPEETMNQSMDENECLRKEEIV